MTQAASTDTLAEIPMYQGEDWSQEFTFYADTAQTQPLVFTNPVMQIRRGDEVYATFGQGTGEGSVDQPADGQAIFTLTHEYTAKVPPGTFPIDIFADVNGKRTAIMKLGVAQINVAKRNTQDTL